MTMSHPNLRNLHPFLKHAGQSATVAINDESLRMIAEGKRVHKFGLGQSPFPVPARVIEALRTHAHQKDYLPTAGLPALREMVAAYTERTLGVRRSAEDVLIGPGSKELIFLIQLAFDATLVLPAPSWVSYDPQARLIGHGVEWVHPEGKTPRLCAASFRKHLQGATPGPRLLILNYPNNPTGLTYTAEELTDIATVAREYGVLILADEIYGELHHEGAHHSIASEYPEGAIVSNGLSKWCGAGGWRLGTCVFPPELSELRRAVAAAGSETFTSVSAPIQYAAVTAFEEHPDTTDYIKRSRQIVKALGNYCASALRGAGAQCPSPEGGFYLFPRFDGLAEGLRSHGIQTAPALTARALADVGTAFLPGSCFGFSPETLAARLAYVDFDGSRALEAANGELDRNWLATYCPSVIDGIDGLASWLQSLSS